MKHLIIISLAVLTMTACTRQAQQAEMNNLRSHDSLMVKQVQQKDSALMAYIRSINRIQNNLDSIKVAAKILKVHGEANADTGTIITDIRMLGKMIIDNNRAITALEVKLKSSDKKNSGLTDMLEHLSKEMNEKDAEIASMQQALGKTNDALNTVIAQFNDSMSVIMKQREEIVYMKEEMNTVYYAIGTMKELKKNGIITKEGGFIGLGRVAMIDKNVDPASFTKADKTALQTIPLDAGFVKLVTIHPADSYKITSSSKEKLEITDADAFWSKSKYLVVVVK